MERIAGNNLADCELIEKIGEGGMRMLRRARETTLDRDIAIEADR